MPQELHSSLKDLILGRLALETGLPDHCKDLMEAVESAAEFCSM